MGVAGGVGRPWAWLPGKRLGILRWRGSDEVRPGGGIDQGSVDFRDSGADGAIGNREFGSATGVAKPGVPIGVVPTEMLLQSPSQITGAAVAAKPEVLELVPRAHPTPRLPAARAFLYVAVSLLAFYLFVPNPGRFSEEYGADTLSNAVAAWHLAETGSVLLPAYEEAATPERNRYVGWFVSSPRGPVSKYPPGAAAFGSLFYLVANDPSVDTPQGASADPSHPPIVLPVPSPGPGRVAGTVSVAVATGLLAGTLVLLGLPLAASVVAGLVVGVATPMWTVASTALWQHGPAALWVALGTFLAAKDRYLLSGLAFGAALITRPPLAIVAASLGIAVSWSQRRARPMLMIGSGTLVGLAGLIAYNWWLWGRVTISGGYGQAFTDNLTDGISIGYLQNVFWAFVHPEFGILIFSAFLLPLLFRIRPAWRDAPAWARGAALGALLYLLVHFSGGSGFIGYRYALEPLIAAAPLLALAYPHWIKSQRLPTVAFWMTVVASLLALIL